MDGVVITFKTDPAQCFIIFHLRINEIIIHFLQIRESLLIH